MLSIERAGANRLDLKMSGKLDADAMGKALDAFVSESEGIENGVVLCDVVDYQLPTLGALSVEFSRLPRLFGLLKRFRRAAVLTGKKWIKTVSELEGKLTPGLEIRAFDRDKKTDAEAWLETAQ